MTDTEKALERFGRNVLKKADKNLITKRKRGRITSVINTTSRLRKSLFSEVEVFKSGNFRFSIFMEDYGLKVDQGSKPGTFPPIPVIRKWMKDKPVRLRELRTGSFIRQTPQALDSVAFLISRKIKREGTEPTNFISDPFKQEFKKLPKDIAEAFSLDAISFLKTSLQQI